MEGLCFPLMKSHVLIKLFHTFQRKVSLTQKQRAPVSGLGAAGKGVPAVHLSKSGMSKKTWGTLSQPRTTEESSFTTMGKKNVILSCPSASPASGEILLQGLTFIWFRNHFLGNFLFQRKRVRSLWPHIHFDQIAMRPC